MLKRLNITATSVPCERVFSTAGLVLNDRRTRLKTKKNIAISVHWLQLKNISISEKQKKKNKN